VVLVDTSVWIEVFRKPSRVDLESTVPFDDVVTCLPIIQEVLQGFRDEILFARARESMLAMTSLESPLRPEVFLQAADLYRSARRAGYTVRSGVDCVIAVCAIRHRAEVLHHDRDYDLLAKVSSLRARRIKLRSGAR
jgi:predicted nucleic acid-binding protein